MSTQTEAPADRGSAAASEPRPRHRRLDRARRRGPPAAPLVVRRLDQPRRAQHGRLHGHEQLAPRRRPRSAAPSRTAPSTSSSRTSTSRPRSRQQLPADYQGLSGAATAGLRQASYQIVDRALEQPAFQELFRVALEESHTTLVQVLEGGGDRVSTRGRRGDARPARDHPRGRRPHRDRRPGRGQDPGRRGPDRGPPLGRARHRAERVPAPEDARLGAPAADARGVRARRLARPRPAPRRPRDRRRARRSSASSASSPPTLTRNYVVDSLVARATTARRRTTPGTSSPSSCAARSG